MVIISMHNSLNHRVKGAALVTSLLILLVLSIIALSFIGGSILAERMAANEQVSTITTNAAQTGNSGQIGLFNRSSPSDVNQIFQQTMAVAVADVGDPVFGFSSNTTGRKVCVNANGDVATTCDGTIKLDSDSNLKTQSVAVYRGCPRAMTACAGSSDPTLCPHYFVMTGTGWYEISGDTLPTNGTDPQSTVENTVITETFYCAKSES